MIAEKVPGTNNANIILRAENAEEKHLLWRLSTGRVTYLPMGYGSIPWDSKNTPIPIPIDPRTEGEPDEVLLCIE
jgi:hypothetical protein